MTGNVVLNSHVYQVEREKKVYTVYQLVNVSNKKILTDHIRIENFRHFSNGKGFDKYLRLRNTNNWGKCEMVTGLFFTNHPNLFYGDRLCGGRRNLMIFQYSNDRNKIVIDYYTGYSPNKQALLNLLEKYYESYT